VPAELDNYDNEPTALFVASQINEWLDILHELREAASKVDTATLPPEQREVFASFKQRATLLDHSALPLSTLMRDMAAYIGRLEYQRETARHAYERGYADHEADLSALLFGETYKTLRDMLSTLKRTVKDK